MGTASLKRPRSGKSFLFLLLCLACFGVSLFLHGIFLIRASRWGVGGFSPESYDTIVPRTFRMKRVEIDPKTLESEKAPVEELPKERPVEMVRETPQQDQPVIVGERKNILSQPTESIPLEKPDAQSQTEGLDTLLKKSEAEVDQTAAVEMVKIPEAALKLPEPMEGMEGGNGEAAGKGTSSQQFSSLDDLLEGTGMVKKNTAPILMPTDLLFEYDADTLKTEAAQTLTKLGSLIKKNAKAFFKIEGHTDSFGSDDYNNQLSLRRAEAVKEWLLTNMGLDASHISTVGMGKSRLLVPTGTVQQQQLNRRVEIIITVPK